MAVDAGAAAGAVRPKARDVAGAGDSVAVEAGVSGRVVVAGAGAAAEEEGQKSGSYQEELQCCCGTG